VLPNIYPLLTHEAFASLTTEARIQYLREAIEAWYAEQEAARIALEIKGRNLL
jgi:hypothetical protein